MVDQVIAADGVTGADAELAAVQGIGFQELVFAFSDQVYGGFNVFQENFSFGGELDTFGAADEEGLVQLFFQYFDGLADGGLGDEELFGCFGKAQGDGDVVKDFI